MIRLSITLFAKWTSLLLFSWNPIIISFKLYWTLGLGPILCWTCGTNNSWLAILSDGLMFQKNAGLMWCTIDLIASDFSNTDSRVGSSDFSNTEV